MAKLLASESERWRGTLRRRRRYDLAVERIAMLERQLEKEESMVRRVEQDADVELCKGLAHVAGGDCEFASAGFDGDLGQRSCAQLEDIFRGRDRAVARLVSRSGESTAQTRIAYPEEGALQ